MLSEKQRKDLLITVFVLSIVSLFVSLWLIFGQELYVFGVNYFIWSVLGIVATSLSWSKKDEDDEEDFETLPIIEDALRQRR